MNCPYCRKRVKDVPDHLESYEESCGKRHAEKLLRDLKVVYATHLKNQTARELVKED